MKLKALFIPTTNSGVQYWRMWNFVNAAYRINVAELHHLWWQKKLHEMHPWEQDILKDDHKWRIIMEIQDWLTNGTQAVVFQLLHGNGQLIDGETAGDYVSRSMALFNAVKDMFPRMPVITEIDDNFLSTPEYNAANPYYDAKGEGMRQLAIEQLRGSDAVIVSTPHLKEVYQAFNDNIFVLPNSIDFEAWDVPRRKRQGLRIGWIGGANHNEDLEMLEKIVPSIRARHPEVIFNIIHGCPHNLRDLEGVEFIDKWVEIDKYPKYLGSLGWDIAMAPLVDNDFNRGKSNLRWLEAAALRIPTVASKVGHFAQTIEDGLNGFLAETPQQFEFYLLELIRNKELRKQMGKNAHQTARDYFNVHKTVRKYVQILEELVTKKSQEELVLQ